MTWLGVIDSAITSLVPVGSMLIANAMNTNGLALNRLRGDVLAHSGEIRGGIGPGSGNQSQCFSVYSRGVRIEFDSRYRFGTLSRNRLDSWANGRYAAFRCATAVCGNLSVCCISYDPCCIRFDVAR